MVFCLRSGYDSENQLQFQRKRVNSSYGVWFQKQKKTIGCVTPPRYAGHVLERSVSVIFTVTLTFSYFYLSAFFRRMQRLTLFYTYLTKREVTVHLKLDFVKYSWVLENAVLGVSDSCCGCAYSSRWKYLFQLESSCTQTFYSYLSCKLKSRD